MQTLIVDPVGGRVFRDPWSAVEAGAFLSLTERYAVREEDAAASFDGTVFRAQDSRGVRELFVDPARLLAWAAGRGAVEVTVLVGSPRAAPAAEPIGFNRVEIV